MKKNSDYMIWAGFAILIGACKNIGMIVLSILGYIFLGIILLFILLILFFICMDRIGERNFSRFKKRNEGNFFLVYGMNKRLRALIDTDLKPLFNMQYKDLLINKNDVIAGQDRIEREYLLRESEKFKFPRVIRIVEGKFLVESFYPEICKLKNGETDKETFKKEIEIKLQKLQK